MLDLAVLAVVADEDRYRYDVVRRLRAAGIEEVGDASVYRTLRRLPRQECADLVRRAERRGAAPQMRYGINAQGRVMLEGQRKDWQEFAGAMSAARHGRPDGRGAGRGTR